MRSVNDSGLASLKTLTGRDPAAVRRRVETVERVMEGVVRIPGLNRRVGLHALLDEIPGGDLIATAMGAYMVWEARNLGMPRSTYVRMAGNLALDAVLGALPVVSVVPHYFFRANTQNLKLIKRHLDKHHAQGAVIDA